MSPIRTTPYHPRVSTPDKCGVGHHGGSRHVTTPTLCRVTCHQSRCANGTLKPCAKILTFYHGADFHYLFTFISSPLPKFANEGYKLLFEYNVCRAYLLLYKYADVLFSFCTLYIILFPNSFLNQYKL